MTFKVFVDGQAGTTGLRLLDYLAQHDQIEVLRIADAKRKDRDERARLLNAADVAFLCLPDEASREAVALIDNPDTCVIDASTAFRTASDWVYGLPELVPEQRARIRTSKRIANPGCHASAFIMLVRPLVEAGLLSSEEVLTAYSLTGYSGGGKNMIAAYEPENGSARDARLESPRPYALGLQHKHLPEMTLHGGLNHAPLFTPIVGPYLQGLSVQLPLPLAALDNASLEHIQAVYQRYYQQESFVSVLPLGDEQQLDSGCWDVQHNNGTNRVDILVSGNADQAILMARLDNLGKGAAGAAIQSMNIHLGIDEDTALVRV
ncbi:N-acetyl-gamma-glutamyl-phosphate reductase [Carnimonas bestiolae]|uniref:N-acetyl-gamma-glutamyl-phosphate reductase n=1 Tax=Carnimonas bestiolae TaxID=3402172 RepID=UPI003EDC3079